MAEVGSMQISGSIQTDNIERGLKRVEDGFKDVDRVGKSVDADLRRTNQEAKRLSRTFRVMALAGAGAMIALAKGAPATASAMAKIEIGTMKLQFAVGEALKEEFNWFADKLDWFAGWVQAHPDLFSGLTTSVLALAGAFVAFKVGGAIITGMTTMVSVASGLIAVVSSPAFIAAVGALAVAAGAWAYVNKLGSEAKAYSAYTQFASAGGAIPEAQYGQAGGFRYYEGGSRGFEGQNPNNQWGIANQAFNYGENQMNIKNVTLIWEDSI